MALRQTSVSRCLDKRLQIAGFDIPDLLAVFFLLSILNFIFGQSDFKLALVWLPTIAVALVLRIAKRGKPEDYLLHAVRHHLRRKCLSAFDDPSRWEAPLFLKGANNAKP
jgi:hypothetical protein